MRIGRGGRGGGVGQFFAEEMANDFWGDVVGPMMENRYITYRIGL